MARVARWLAVAAAIVVALGLVVAGYLFVQAQKRPNGRPEYVALGSSFAAGPGIAPRTTDTPAFCFQSDRNYAHQVARTRQLSLVDRSCGGATSGHLLRNGLLFQGPQLGAVTRETRLVTITIGGNDVAYLGNLIALGCGDDTSRWLRWVGGCRLTDDPRVETGFAQLRANLRETGRVIHERAPEARILLITYPTILPAQGTCPRLGLTEAAADRMRVVAFRLEAETRAAASAMRAEFVDAASLSRDHGVCAAEPWITAAHPGSYAPLHPNLAGMTAVAHEIDRVLVSPAPASADHSR